MVTYGLGPDDVLSEFLMEEVRRRREVDGVSYATLARDLNVSRPTIQKMENRDRLGTAGKLKVAKALGCDDVASLVLKALHWGEEEGSDLNEQSRTVLSRANMRSLAQAARMQREGAHRPHPEVEASDQMLATSFPKLAEHLAHMTRVHMETKRRLIDAARNSRSRRLQDQGLEYWRQVTAKFETAEWALIDTARELEFGPDGDGLGATSTASLPSAASEDPEETS